MKTQLEFESVVRAESMKGGGSEERRKKKT